MFEPPDRRGMAREGLAGKRFALFGSFEAGSQREVRRTIVDHGGSIDDVDPDVVVLGELAHPTADRDAQDFAARHGVAVVRECDLWTDVGLVDAIGGVRGLYTTAMLARVTDVESRVIRRWVRRGWVRPRCAVNRMPYFDYRELTVARLLSRLVSQGASLAGIDQRVERLMRDFPQCARPLTDLEIHAECGELLVRGTAQASAVDGQRKLGFSSEGSVTDTGEPRVIRFSDRVNAAPVDSKARAWRLHDSGEVGSAIEAYRLALLQSRPTADDYYVLAEWLFDSGQPEAARERCYAALELDPDHAEARYRLGCALADEGELELAIATLEGLVERFGQCADAHYLLARLLERCERWADAQVHWRALLRIAPEGPWARDARDRVGGMSEELLPH